MDPVRLAFDVGPLYGHRTGVGAAVAALDHALAAHPGVDVHPYVLSFRARTRPPRRRLPLPAAAAHRLWARFDHPRVDRWLGGVDVVHGTNYVVPPTRRPRLVSVYDCWFLSHPDQATPAVRRAADVLRRSVRGGAVVHASSAATAAAVRDLLDPRRVEVVHLAPLPAPAPPAEGPAAPFPDLVRGRPFVLALGTVERRKNLPALVAAFAATTSRDETLLVLAGAPGDDDAEVDAAVATLPAAMQRRVLRVGRVDAATKAWLLHHCALLAYPSLDEGFGFPVLEAQAAGVPVVATRAGSIPEVGGAGVELVAVGDTAALAAALDRILADDARRAELVAAGSANLGRFSWTRTADALAAVYRRLRDEGSS